MKKYQKNKKEFRKLQDAKRIAYKELRKAGKLPTKKVVCGATFFVLRSQGMPYDEANFLVNLLLGK